MNFGLELYKMIRLLFVFFCFALGLGSCSSFSVLSSEESVGNLESKTAFLRDYRVDGGEWKKLVASARGEGGLSSMAGPPEPSRLYFTQIYGLIRPDFGVGTILVKEENLSLRPWGSEDSTQERVTAISVMRRTQDSRHRETAGWSFEAYDPDTLLPLEDESPKCLSCHSKYSGQDWRAVVGHELEPTD